MGAPLETSNMGVSALAVSFFSLIKDIDEGAELCLMVGRSAPCTEPIDLGTRKLNVNVVNCRMSPRSAIQEHILWILFMAAAYRYVPGSWLRKRILRTNTWLRNIHEADFIGSIHGGDGFSDIYGLERFLSGVLPDLSALLMGKDLVLLPQTYGPYFHPMAKWMAQIIIRRASKVLSRDRQGLSTIEELIGKRAAHKIPAFCPDVAFTLESILPENPSIVPPIQKKPDAPLIGLNVSGMLFNGGLTRDNMFGLQFDYRQFIEAVVHRFLTTTLAHIILVPHTYAYPGNVESDPDACAFIEKRFAPEFPGRIHLVTEKYDQSRVKGVIALCDFFIGSRMHACIAALSQGIPAVGVAYSRKFAGVFEAVNARDSVVDGRKTDMQTAIEHVMRHFDMRESIKEGLNAEAEGARQKVRHVFEAIAAKYSLSVR